MPKRECYEMACSFLSETAKAVQILDYETGEQLWIPISQVEEMHHRPDGTGTIRMTNWIAKQKGLI